MLSARSRCCSPSGGCCPVRIAARPSLVRRPRNPFPLPPRSCAMRRWLPRLRRLLRPWSRRRLRRQIPRRRQRPNRRFARDGLAHALGMGGDSGATRATLLGPPRHRAPSATEDGGGMANPGLNRSMQHGSAPPRAQVGQTWFIHDEAHWLQSRVIVNANASKNRYSGTIPGFSPDIP